MDQFLNAHNGRSALISVRGVSKVYHSGDLDVPVLHDINLDLFPGQVTVIVGPSGSGKSTLINMIGGIDSATTGSIFFEGDNISGFSEKQLTAYRRQKIGFIFQFYNLVATLTAIENVRVATEISSGAMDALDALRLVDMEHRQNHFPAQLSGGEQQRVAIARAIAKCPTLLLCDEPTGALDLETGRMVLHTLVELSEKTDTTVVIITHNSAIAGISDRLIRLGSGTITEDRDNKDHIAADEVTW